MLSAKVIPLVLDRLSEKLRFTLKKIANATNVDSGLIKEVVKDIQRALISADVDVHMVLDLSKRIEKRALTEEPPKGMSSREHVIRIVYDELVNILGTPKDIPLKKQRIMLVGLYGQGKTTTTAKLARYFQRRGMRVALIAGDVHRPAAYDQLKQLGDEINVPVFGIKGTRYATKIVRRGLEKYKDYDIVIIDTSGRHSLEDDLIKEMKAIAKVAKPDEIFLIIDAAMGQQAGAQARAFHEAVGVSGVILTKLDGTAKGGGALSAVQATKAPVVFVGVGERIDDLEHFNPPRFISRILGMGDLQTLLEKAEEVMDESQAEEMAKRIMSGKFTLNDMYAQMESLSKMGPLKKIASYLPWVGDKISTAELETSQEKLRKFRIIMDSMTDEERSNPRILKASRIKRIARGSGTRPEDVRELLKYYNQSRKAIKGYLGNRRMRKALMKQLKFADDMFDGG